jgi:hypothetical protein
LFIPSSVSWARIAAKPPAWIKRKRARGKRGAGRAYEAKVHEWLLGQYDTYMPGLWFCYGTAQGDNTRWCQPDGILLDLHKPALYIIEVKLSHTERSFWQLRELYLPVVTRAWGADWPVRLVEVVRWYNPDAEYPGKIKLISEIEQASPESIGVFIWSPSRNR